jgi:hypothetical protein
MNFKINSSKFLFFSIVLLLFSCSGKKYVEVKSPCASSFGGPCGEKKPVNDWWLKDKTYNKLT